MSSKRDYASLDRQHASGAKPGSSHGRKSPTPTRSARNAQPKVANKTEGQNSSPPAAAGARDKRELLLSKKAREQSEEEVEEVEDKKKTAQKKKKTAKRTKRALGRAPGTKNPTLAGDQDYDRLTPSHRAATAGTTADDAGAAGATGSSSQGPNTRVLRTFRVQLFRDAPGQSLGMKLRQAEQLGSTTATAPAAPRGTRGDDERAKTRRVSGASSTAAATSCPAAHVSAATYLHSFNRGPRGEHYPAEKSDLLRLGDVVVSVCGIDVRGWTVPQVAELIGSRRAEMDPAFEVERWVAE